MIFRHVWHGSDFHIFIAALRHIRPESHAQRKLAAPSHTGLIVPAQQGKPASPSITLEERRIRLNKIQTKQVINDLQSCLNNL
jgi:hypothetical protein